MMTPAQRQDSELLKSLGRPAEAIAANTGLPLETVTTWLRSGRWPGPKQGRLFDPTGYSPRPSKTKPTDTVVGISGLSLFAQTPTGKSESSTATPQGSQSHDIR